MRAPSGTRLDFLHTHVAHFEEAISDHPEWRDFHPDDDAQFLSWFLASLTDWVSTPVILSASNIVPAIPEAREWRTVIPQPSAHDPPGLNATPPRAPPV